MRLPDRSRFLATILDYASVCDSLEAYRRRVLDDLRTLVGSDGALYRPSAHWAQSSTLYLDEGPHFTDIYVRARRQIEWEILRRSGGAGGKG